MKSQTLPTPSPAEQSICSELHQYIVTQIRQNNGHIPFAELMNLALYTPQLGYYNNHLRKFGREGDFITAPNLTPLFAQTLAVQLRHLLTQTQACIYEFGAGTGELATDLLNALGDAVDCYYIIDLSANLIDRQIQHIQKFAPQYAHKVQHLSHLPDSFNGILIGNEVLDAMPVERIHQAEDGTWFQIVVQESDGQLYEAMQPLADTQILQLAQSYFPNTSTPYTSELHLAQNAFIQTLAQRLQQGAMIWIDYGFDAQQYYHPQRHEGTFIGHYRHHVIHDPFSYLGLTDLTTHINFTDIAQAGCDAGLDLIGYTSQAHFLLNLGITDILEKQYTHPDEPAYIQAAQAINMLTAPHEMGELFKVIAFGKNIDPDWQGFMHGDLCHKL